MQGDAAGGSWVAFSLPIKVESEKIEKNGLSYLAYHDTL
jgi:hypothetical protein